MPIVPGDYKLTFYAIIGKDAPSPIEEILLTRVSRVGPNGQATKGKLTVEKDFYEKLTEKGEKKF